MSEDKTLIAIAILLVGLIGYKEWAFSTVSPAPHVKLSPRVETPAKSQPKFKDVPFKDIPMQGLFSLSPDPGARFLRKASSDSCWIVYTNGPPDGPRRIDSLCPVYPR